MPTPQNREPGRRPRNPDTERYTMQGDWAVPNQHPTAPPQRRAPTQEQRRAAARRRREIRRRRRRLAVLGTVGAGGIGYVISNCMTRYAYGQAIVAIALVLAFTYAMELGFTAIKERNGKIK